jgi:hypothetical protein
MLACTIPYIIYYDETSRYQSITHPSTSISVSTLCVYVCVCERERERERERESARARASRDTRHDRCEIASLDAYVYIY